MSFKDLREKVTEDTKKVVNNSTVIQAALNVKINHPTEYRFVWSEYERIILEGLELLGYDIKNPIIIAFGAIDGKWILNELVNAEYNNMSFWNPVPMENAIERELNLDDCYVEFWFDKQEKKPKFNKKTGMRKPEATKFVMPL